METNSKFIETFRNNENFNLGFDKSIETLPSLPLFFLDPKNLYEWREFCGLPLSLDFDLKLVAEIIADSLDLKLLAWHTYRRMYTLPEDNSQFNDWPELKDVLGEKAGLFFLIIAMAMVPHTKNAHEKLSVPINVTKDTCQQIRHFTDNYRRDNPDQWGLLLRQLYWLRHYPRAQIFRIGRFEYKVEAKNINIRVIKNKKNSQIKALARDGLRLNVEGYMLPVDNLPEKGEFNSTLILDEKLIKGHIVSPTSGSVSIELKTFSLSEWEIILWKGDWVLDLHIPAGGSMTLDLCKDSFNKAFKFFDQYLPSKIAKAIICHSWVFSPVLSQIIKPKSNLIYLQEIVNLYPIPKNSRDGFFFLFGSASENAQISDFPRDTSLQRSILEYIENGNSWFGGGMFLLRESVEDY
jgi:hypothetical protein